MLQPLHQPGLGLGDAEGTSSPPTAGTDPAGLTAALSTPTRAALPQGYQLPAPLPPGDRASRRQTSCYTRGRQVPASLLLHSLTAERALLVQKQVQHLSYYFSPSASAPGSTGSLRISKRRARSTGTWVAPHVLPPTLRSRHHQQH